MDRGRFQHCSRSEIIRLPAPIWFHFEHWAWLAECGVEFKLDAFYLCPWETHRIATVLPFSLKGFSTTLEVHKAGADLPEFIKDTCVSRKNPVPLQFCSTLNHKAPVNQPVSARSACCLWTDHHPLSPLALMTLYQNPLVIHSHSLPPHPSLPPSLWCIPTLIPSSKSPDDLSEMGSPVNWCVKGRWLYSIHSQSWQ